MSTFKTIWTNKALILEGVMNNIFKKESVEEIAEQRLEICSTCPSLDKEGTSCLVPGTQPCCGECGCSLKLKVRSLSSSCGDEENPRWFALVDTEEEIEIKTKINYEE